ncbi:hypothetical protein F1880_008782 [Penicillium rolfsii]|nr:hypothetical protein F1880_008782 [Penicillium rolfsii]
MAPSVRKSDFDAYFLDRLIGTKVTTYYDVDPPQELSAVTSASELPIRLSTDSNSKVFPPLVSSTTANPPPVLRTAVYPTAASPPIEPSLSISGSQLPKDEVNMGAGPPRTVGLFVCHLEEEPARIAFMRVYHQIPVIRTEFASSAIRAQQAHPGKVCGEYESLKVLMKQGCDVVPRLLGYNEKKQEQNDLLPGGFIKYVVWEKVPGQSLTKKSFWSLDRPLRDHVRAKFRAAYKKLLDCGVAPQLGRISKIIYDHLTGDIRISGFQRGWPILDKLEWSDTLYFRYGLAEPVVEDLDWSQHPENWKW